MAENRRLFVLIGAIVVILLGGFLVVRGGSGHTLTIKSIPNDLTLTLDGRSVPANGDVRVKAGRHTLTGDRRGFATYTQTVDVRADATYKMYLFSDDAEGRAWETAHPADELETESEVGRRFDELDRRLEAKYPLLQELPVVGRGFTIDQGVSRKHPGDLAFYVKLAYPEGRKNSRDWLAGHGYDPDRLELVYSARPGG